MRKTIIAGNWKMNKDLEGAIDLAKSVVLGRNEVRNIQMILGVPYPFLTKVADICKEKSDVDVAAQNLYPADEGAYTGEVSGPMILSCGGRYAIIGHSERREYFHEDNDFINRKVNYALRSGLEPILCIGEPLKVRQKEEHVSYVLDQLQKCIEGIPKEKASKLMLAYEPVWAIGTGRTAKPSEAQDMHASIREFLNDKWGSISDDISILYGGSMKPNNAESLLKCEDIDGGLIGGASLESHSFIEIWNIAESLL